MNVFKVLIVTVGVFMLAVFAAPLVLGGFIVASASRTANGRAALTTATVLSDKEVQRKLIERAIERDTEALGGRSGSVVQSDYSRSTSTFHEVPSHPAPEPGQPMLDPTPSR